MINKKTTEQVSQLSASKRALLQKLLLDENAGQSAQREIRRRDSDEPAPLSSAQQRLWFLDQLEPGSPAYNIPITLSLTGDLNVRALELSLNTIIARHEVLRTIFPAVDGQAAQIISTKHELALPQVDLRELPEEERTVTASSTARDEARRPFDLSLGPVIRALLFKLTADQWALLVVVHHIVADGWSLSLLIDEMAKLYAAFISGRPSPLKDLPIQYADFACWQRQWLKSEQVNGQLRYWKQQLEGAPAVLELPADRPRPFEQTFNGAHYPFSLSQALTERVNAMSLGNGTTAFITLMTNFNGLLCKHTGREDILVGTPIANRNRPEIEALIGFFVNTVVIRTRLFDNPSFQTLLHQVHKTCLDAFSNQDLPFERLVEALQPDRLLMRSPLVQCMFTMQNVPGRALYGSGLSSKPLQVDIGTAKYDLSLSLAESEGVLTGSFEYNTDLFDETTIARMAAHFEKLLDSALANPSVAISDLNMLTVAEFRQLTVDWNAECSNRPRGLCLNHLFEQQVERTPDATAVVFKGQAVSYDELNRMANRIARHLRSVGVAPEIAVGLCMQKSAQMVAAALGILKAGGVYVPLDTAYPKERLAFMIEDAGIEVLLTEEGMVEQLPADDATRVCLNDGAVSLAGLPEHDLESATDLDNLAYIIYTSGSTGKPKGVPITHENIAPLLLWNKDYFDFGPRTVALHTLSISFDFGVFEILSTILFGGALHLIDLRRLSGTGELAEYVRRCGINTLHCTPSLAREIISAGRRLDTITTVHAGGEELTTGLLSDIFSFTGRDCAIFNGYGPAEVSIQTAISKTGSEFYSSADRSLGISVGRPSAGNEVFILDRSLQVVPVGAHGELCVSGPGLSRGYVKRPDLTAEKFIPNPFSSRPGQRLYRTGDLARFRPDGTIEFLGRLDNQVKVRGYRIELGEVEHCLLAHPSIRQAVATLKETPDGDKVLVAYAVANSEGGFQDGELRAFLSDRVPDYMVPAFIIKMDTIPVSANGKIDYAALPDPGPAQAVEKRRGPRNPIEEILQGIWSEVMKRPDLSIDDNFFEMGGHSLMVTQITSRIRSSLNVELPVKKIFEAPTVARLTEAIEAIKQGGQGFALPPIKPVPRDQRLPLSYGQNRLWFLDQFEPGSAFYNIAERLPLLGALDLLSLERSLTEIIRRHEILRTIFAEDKEGPIQIILPASRADLRMIDISELQAEQQSEELKRVALMEARQPFNLSRGPLLKTRLVRLGATQHMLLLTLHHIISDGWSATILNQELRRLYEAYREAKEAGLAELEIQYADYAVWQKQQMESGELAGQIDYWKRRLQGAASVLELPTDYPRPAAKSYKGASVSAIVQRETVEALRAISRRQNVTLYMMLLTGYKTLLMRYSGQQDILVGTPVAGRTRGEVEGLIGFFVNTLVMRSKVRGEMRVKELIEEVRESVIAGQENQEVPFEKVVEEVGAERSLSHDPLFQVMFSYQNMRDRKPELSGSSLEMLKDEITASTFDLSLTVIEAERDELLAVLEYSEDLFEQRRMARMLDHLLRILESFIRSLETPVADVCLLSDAEVHQLLREWNDTQANISEGRCAHELFERWAQRSPEATAVAFKDQTLTYGKLNEQATQLARYLRRRDIGPNCFVGICMERGLEMIVAVMGTLKAGAAFVPIDPMQPESRLAFMLDDAGVDTLLTQQRLVERLSANEIDLIPLDMMLPEIGREAKENFTAGSQAKSLAYVIYTSGSTGQPRGVMIQHRSLINYVEAVIVAYRITAHDRVLQFSSLSFDASIEEIFTTLMAGAQLVLRSDESIDSPAAFLRFCGENEVSVIDLPTAYWHELAAHASRDDWRRAASLRLITIGGEKAASERFADWRRNAGSHIRMTNVYGPTEATIGSTVSVLWDIQDAPLGDSDVTIGRPIANAQVYVLEAGTQLSPVGAPGELHIGGYGVGLGYLNQAELTAEKFVPNPFGNEPGSRLYRTGDKARLTSDGRIEFLGRIDNQIKLRGYRIELEEIENALRRHPNIQEAIVILQETTTKAGRLIAYAVAAKDKKVNPAELQAFLRESLPEYMIPAAYLMLDKIPTTVVGKVNRQELPDPSEQDRTATGIAPRTVTEELLGEIWADLLSVKAIGVNDNFFDLGGHSLLATQLISRIRDAFRIELALRAVFEAPTLAGLSSIVEAARRGSNESQAHSLSKVPRTGELPLSYAQQRLWFLDQLQPGNPFYNVPQDYYIDGDLNIPALEKSLSAIVKRHEVLRTVFPAIDGKPHQQIMPPSSVRLSVIDLELLEPDRRSEELKRVALMEARQPFNLSRGPLLKTKLVRLGATQHMLLLTLHHIISDGWSATILNQELRRLYEAYREAKEAGLAELEIQYADYAVWQKQQMESGELAGQIDYWKRRLQGAASVLELPTDYPRPAAKSYSGEALTVVYDSRLREELEGAGRRHNATLYMMLLTGYKTLLMRYSGQQDILVGTPVAGRTRGEVEGLIGFFVNTLVMRNKVRGEMRVKELIEEVRESVIAGQENQEVPFEKVVEEVGAERSLSHDPLFQVMFSFLNTPREKIDLPDTNIVSRDAQIGVVQFDLKTTMMKTSSGELYATIEYSTDLYEAERIRRMAGHLRQVLEAMAAEPERKLSELTLMSEREREQLIREWNQTRADYPWQRLAQELFEQQARERGERVAIEAGGQQMSYEELNRKANQVGKYLRGMGVGAEVVVGVCAERGIEMVIGLMGVMKAGAAYLPLDPDYPVERLSYMLEDSQAPILLTQSRLEAQLPAFWGQVVTLESIIEMEDSAEPFECCASPDNLAYVIYTSGTTGRPKGVMITHQGLVNYLVWCAKSYPRSNEGVVPLHSSIAFDLSITSLFHPLTTGQRIMILEANPGIEQLAASLKARSDFSLIKLTPSHLDMMSHLVPAQDIHARAAALVIGGEALTESTLSRWRGRLSGTRLINEYGPTETVVGCCVYDATANSGKRETVPIGRPIDNTEIYILDREYSPVPIGITGELFIGGDGVGRGYRNLPDLTADSFTPDPFSDRPGARLYKTRDLARFLSDGNIELQGRCDDQVKLRGYRIELGEVESALLGHSGIRDAVVAVREDNGTPHLVAYVVAEQERQPSVAELLELLQTRLPHYMVPTAYVFLSELPLSPNGKVDRRSLPAPGNLRSEIQQEYVAPRNQAEEVLAAIWSSTLGINRIGMNDNFFDLGGHSLLATQVISRGRELLGVDIPLRAIFEAPTIASLAVVVAQLQAEMSDADSLADILAEMEQLTDEEVEAMIRESENSHGEPNNE